jgi:hypothetical protein
MTEWKGTLKGTEDTYPHLSSVRDRFKENDDIVHAAICDAALSLISDQALAIHRLRESMRVLAYLNPNIENDVDNPWLVAHQVREHVRERIEELEATLKPFAAYYSSDCTDLDPDYCVICEADEEENNLTVGLFRAAHKVLERK